MTEKVKQFGLGIGALQGGAKGQGFRKGVEAINLAAIFQARGIVFGAPEQSGMGVPPYNTPDTGREM